MNFNSAYIITNILLWFFTRYINGAPVSNDIAGASVVVYVIIIVGSIFFDDPDMVQMATCSLIVILMSFISISNNAVYNSVTTIVLSIILCMFFYRIIRSRINTYEPEQIHLNKVLANLAQILVVVIFRFF